MLTALTKFVNLLAAGKTAPSILTHLFGVTLLACKKKNGSFHSIVVGAVLRHSMSKFLAQDWLSVHLPSTFVLPCNWV